MRSDSTPDVRTRVVLKLGGTSVADAAAWEAIERILRRRIQEGEERILVVHSALPGVTDALEMAEDPEKVSWVSERTRDFARELLGSVPEAVEEELVELAEEAAALREAGAAGDAAPAIRARILAMGERMATRVGSAFLASRGVEVEWLDARDLLASRADPSRPEALRRLSAECDADLDPELRDRLDGLAGIGLTQGYVARDPDGDTVVLGRGGSDTSAAYLAGRWGADRLEIWSGVPGMFSADPVRIPAARLLHSLSYAEAQEIATTGSRVLHPRCIPALRHRAIPVHLYSTSHPEAPGTVIGGTTSPGSSSESQLKAVSWKRGVVLVSMETLGMWQEVGFLARAFAAFAEAGLSVDLVSTSETNVTVSLDASANLLDPDRLDALVSTLEAFCRVEVIQPCAAVSLVGNRIRGLLHRLTPALEVFSEHRIYMVSQAANDLNLTVVVDEDQGERLARQLHRTLVSEPAPPEVFGPSWLELTGPPAAEREPAWWVSAREPLLERFGESESAYVYHLGTVRERVRRLRKLAPVDRVFYAMKANPHPALLDTVHEEGAGFECVSRGELEAVRGRFPDLPGSSILFTPNFAPRSEYAFALEAGVQVTLDALHPIVHWPELFQGHDLFVRIDPGQGAGHHEKVSTAGQRSKFGVQPDDLDELAERVEGAGARVVGLHVHAGSGILGAEHWPRMGRFLLGLADRFPAARVLDVGGGLPVPQSPGDVPLELDRLEKGLVELRSLAPGFEIWLEPGRYLVAEAGVLLARVTQTKRKGSVGYVGLATGMNSLIRPALYGSHHRMVNLTRLDEPATERVQVVGPICETGDRLGVDRLLPPTHEGDVILIENAGAYGRAMASSYNLRPPAPEWVIAGSLQEFP